MFEISLNFNGTKSDLTEVRKLVKVKEECIE